MPASETFIFDIYAVVFEGSFCVLGLRSEFGNTLENHLTLVKNTTISIKHSNLYISNFK